MSRLNWLACLFLGFQTGLAGAAGKQQPPSSPNAQVESQLKTLFNKADLNQDGYLDKEELARSFRGPSAKPPQQDLYDDKGRLNPAYSQARTKYPEMVFLWTADKDGDSRVSWEEYLKYGLDSCAAQQKQQQALQRALQSASRQLSRSRGSGQRQAAQMVRNLQRQYANQERQMLHYLQNMERFQNDLERAYQSAMQQRMQMLRR